MVIDLDDFKSINDTWGHPTGDSTLLAVVDIIGQYIGPNDIFARISGEGVWYYCEKSSLKDAIEFSNMLRNNVKN
ncbi:diguanylate cyclase [Klebsiella pneumoniae subsp. pneumoniae]|nr:diguanylate cyclase [Klebsiella pneumoniae subsp. pneumoniae]